MGNIGIITDSIHGLPPELIEKYDIRVAPMGINLNNKHYSDMVDIRPTDIYKLLKEMKSPGTTSAASPGDFLQIYESLSQKVDGILYIGVSKALTATYDIAYQTRQMFLENHPEIRIELADSKNCLGALGFLILEAARAAESGKNLDEVLEVVNEMIPRVKYLSMLDTLEYLVKIGRMPKTAIANEATLNVRPIIGMTDVSGVIQNITAAPKPQALDKLLEITEKYIDPSKPLHAMLHYSEYMQEAIDLKNLFSSRYNCVEFYMTEYSPAALCGTGLMTGIAFYS